MEERVTFMFLLEMISLSWLVPPARAIWCKEHSSHWWEHVVNTTFTPQDWLRNFCMSRDTFLHLCESCNFKDQHNNANCSANREASSHHIMVLGKWFRLQDGWSFIWRSKGNSLCNCEGSLCIHCKTVATQVYTNTNRISIEGHCGWF